MKKLSQLLKDRLKARGLYSQALGARVCGIANQILGEEGRAASYKNGVLTVAAKNSAALSNLQINQKELLTKINQLLGEELVKRIKYQIG